MPTQNSSPKTFNLADQPWIPVAGEHDLRSLMQIFTGPAPKRLSGNAVDKIVMFRFLLSIVHASSPIPDAAAWRALTPEKIAENARNYLSANRQFFDLYDPERPFLQFPQLKEKIGKIFKDGKKEEIEKSVWTMRVNYSDNQPILSSWQVPYYLSDDEIARFLLRMNCAALASKIFKKDILLSPSRSPEKRANGAPGTLLGTGTYGYLHSYLSGDDLWESLHLNLLTEEDIKKTGAYPEGLGKPFWEEMPTGEYDERAKHYRNSYFGRIFPIDKCVLLTDGGNKVIKTDGIPYASGIDVRDPALTVYEDKNGLSAVKAEVAVRPWRELASLLNFLNSKDDQSPYFLSLGLNHLRETDTKVIRFWVGGVEISNMSGGQQIKQTNDYIESEFLMTLDQLGTQFLQKYKKLMQQLDVCCNSLFQAVNEYFFLLYENPENEKNKKKHQSELPGKLARRAKTQFWEQMESRAQIIIDLAEGSDEDAEKKEFALWRKIVSDIYNEFCPHETARQLAAWVEANPKFNRKKGKNKNGK